MNALRILGLAMLVAAATASAGDPLPPLVCTPRPIACEPSASRRIDPQLQRLLVERQLQTQPPYWTAVYFYVPALGEREQLELQIRYLEELLAREKEKARRLAGGD